ncbi:MAG: TIGR00341 family protein [Phocaeicola sp.]|uniref:TIGR00341 family protein n=1 Tax=Phocaeicola TaxID=909656 RepID=UPI00234EA8C7|nr:TIGR00341 family protein [Phocaeicola oris]MCE2617145.1 TIGR00341 family protein [Phocaeicola oris]
MEQKEKTLWQVVKGYFNALPDKENEEETVKQISSGVVFHGANLWVLVFAIFIASLGLNVNSTAVIIGAMLISPLMGPIIGMGLAIGISDLELLKRSIKNYLVATVISVLTATLYFFITPLNEAQSELLARTSPTLYDMLIALCGGAAGILALSTRGKGNVIPGVAIATALMPPLCTAGYGLAVGNFSYFFGAFYLFFINTVFIALSTFLGVRMLHFKYKTFIDPARLTKVKRYIIGIVVLTMIPATYMTVQIIRQSVLDNNTRKFVKNELSFKGTQIISQSRDEKLKTLNVVAVGRIITPESIGKARELMNRYRLDNYELNVIQGSQSDSLLLLNQALNTAATNKEITNRKLLEQDNRIHTLEAQLADYTRYTTLGKDIRKEVKAVCPEVKSISLSQITEAKTDTSATLQYVLAVIDCRKGLKSVERERLRSWLKERARADSLRLLVTQ